jgi:hypothetical protein
MQYFIRPLRAVTKRRPTARALASALGAAALALGLVAATGAPASLAATKARPAATAETWDLTSGTASFKSDGHTWSLEVGALGGRSSTVTGTNEVNFYISTPHLSGTEFHGWDTSTPAPAKDFTVTGSGGATLSTGTFMSPIASFSLKFAPSSHAKEVCSSGKGTVYKGVLSGKVSLKTGLHGVGVSKKLTFKGTELIVSQSCVPPLPCFLANWAAGSSTGVLAEGYEARFSAKTESYAVVGKFEAKTASKVLERSDEAFIAAPAPVFDAKTKSLTVSASKAGIVTGAGVIAHTVEPVKPQTGTCSIGKQKYTETESFYDGTFTASKLFVAHTLLTGNLTAPKTSAGEFEIITLKKK